MPRRISTLARQCNAVAPFFPFLAVAGDAAGCTWFQVLLEVILTGLVSTPRKLGTTRLWTLNGPSHPDTDAPFLEEHAIAVREVPNLHLEFCQPDVPMECGHLELLLMRCQRVFRILSKFHRTLRTQCSLLFFSISLQV